MIREEVLYCYRQHLLKSTSLAPDTRDVTVIPVEALRAYIKERIVKCSESNDPWDAGYLSALEGWLAELEE